MVFETDDKVDTDGVTDFPQLDSRDQALDTEIDSSLPSQEAPSLHNTQAFSVTVQPHTSTLGEIIPELAMDQPSISVQSTGGGEACCPSVGYHLEYKSVEDITQSTVLVVEDDQGVEGDNVIKEEQGVEKEQVIEKNHVQEDSMHDIAPVTEKNHILEKHSSPAITLPYVEQEFQGKKRVGTSLYTCDESSDCMVLSELKINQQQLASTHENNDACNSDKDDTLLPAELCKKLKDCDICNSEAAEHVLSTDKCFNKSSECSCGGDMNLDYSTRCKYEEEIAALKKERTHLVMKYENLEQENLCGKNTLEAFNHTLEQVKVETVAVCSEILDVLCQCYKISSGNFKMKEILFRWQQYALSQSNTIATLASAQEKLTNDANTLSQELQQCRTEIQELSNRIAVLTQKNTDLENAAIVISEKYSSGQAQISNLQSLLEEKTAENTKCTSIITDLNSTKEQLETTITRLEQEISLLTDASENNKRNNNDVKRLQEHLVQVEEMYVAQVLKLEESKKVLENQVQTLSCDLNRSKAKIQEARANYENQSKLFNQKFNTVSKERDSLISEVVTLSNVAESQKSSLMSLQSSLSDSQKEFESQIALLNENHATTMAEAEIKWKQQADEQCEAAVQAIQEKLEQRIAQLNTQLEHRDNQLQHVLDQLESLQKSHETIITDHNTKPSIITATITDPGRTSPSSGEAAAVNTMEEGDSLCSSSFPPSLDDREVHSILLKNLFLAYLRIDPQHKGYALRAISQALGVSKAEFEQASSGGAPSDVVGGRVKSTLGWIPGISRWIGLTHTEDPSGGSSSKGGAAGPSSNEESISQLFLKYIEQESDKALLANPYVPPVSVQELNNILIHHTEQAKGINATSTRDEQQRPPPPTTN